MTTGLDLITVVTDFLLALCSPGFVILLGSGMSYYHGNLQI